MNFYFGGLFLFLGIYLLHRIKKRQGIVSTDLKNQDGHMLLNDEEASESLLRESEKGTYKGGVGADILHAPLSYKDSWVVEPQMN